MRSSTKRKSRRPALHCPHLSMVKGAPTFHLFTSTKTVNGVPKRVCSWCEAPLPGQRP